MYSSVLNNRPGTDFSEYLPSFLFRPGSNLYLLHQKLDFTDTDLAENFNLADNIAKTRRTCLKRKLQYFEPFWR